MSDKDDKNHIDFLVQKILQDENVKIVPIDVLVANCESGMINIYGAACYICNLRLDGEGYGVLLEEKINGYESKGLFPIHATCLGDIYLKKSSDNLK